ncbi:MAG: hypothetical protein KatS3mg117_1503 [Geminicoccaceae bacterium]|jgi:hypothetical protein|nr:MAG: hypothetical protein KatS3mg117_1503 [Geminicoccaceae bacterium]
MKGGPPRRLVERRIFPGARPASPRDRDTGHRPRRAPRRAALRTVPTDPAPATIGEGIPEKTGERRSSGAQDLFEIGEGAAATIGNADRAASRATRPGPDPVGRTPPGPCRSPPASASSVAAAAVGEPGACVEGEPARARSSDGSARPSAFFGRNRRTRSGPSSRQRRPDAEAEPTRRIAAHRAGSHRADHSLRVRAGRHRPASRYGRTARGAGANEIEIGPVGVAELAAHGRQADRWARGPAGGVNRAGQPLPVEAGRHGLHGEFEPRRARSTRSGKRRRWRSGPTGFDASRGRRAADRGPFAQPAFRGRHGRATAAPVRGVERNACEGGATSRRRTLRAEPASARGKRAGEAAGGAGQPSSSSSSSSTRSSRSAGGSTGRWRAM